MGNRLVDPKLVARTYVAPKRRASRTIYKAHYRIAVNGRRYGLAKLQVPKPGLFTRDGVQFLRAQIVEVEDQEVVFQAGAEVHQLRAGTRALSCQQGEVLRAEPAYDVGFSRFKAQYLCVFAADEKKNQLIQIWQSVVVMIDFPVIRVAFQHDSLSGKIFLDSKRPQTHDLRRRRVEGPTLDEPSLAIGFFEDVLRQHGQAV